MTTHAHTEETRYEQQGNSDGSKGWLGDAPLARGRAPCENCSPSVTSPTQ